MLESLRELADVYRAGGSMAEAIALDERALPISVAVLGADHADTRALVSHLADAYRTVGREQKADALLRGYPP